MNTHKLWIDLIINSVDYSCNGPSLANCRIHRVVEFTLCINGLIIELIQDFFKLAILEADSIIYSLFHFESATFYILEFNQDSSMLQGLSS